MRKSKTPKKKPYRSSISNALWCFHGMLKYAPMSFVLMALEVPINVFLAWAGVYLPSLAAAEVTGHKTLRHAAVCVGLLVFVMFAARVIKLFANSLSTSFLMVYIFKKRGELFTKSMECFYQTYEKKENRDLYSRAVTSTEMWDGVYPISDMPIHSFQMIENIICYCLFSAIISFVSPWLIPLLTIAPAVNWLCARAYRSWEYTHREKWTDIDQKLWYSLNKPEDLKASKDIRIYGMAGWFHEIFLQLSKARSVWDKKLCLKSFLSRIADLFVILIRDGAAYAILIRMILSGELTIDKFILYFAAISQFATFVGNIINEWNTIHDVSLKLCDFREYTDMPEYDGTGEADINEHLSRAPEIRFEHVSFRYEGAETDTLKDINITIRSGEKIALVGLNGAGKTTLVKLLCGLYLPTEGDIKINGVSIHKFLRKDYYRLFSPVFQDIETTFFSLAETVSGQIGDGTDFKRAEECMRLAGLGEKLDALPEGIHTKLDKQVNKDGTDLSGGELQKLMLARALYKDAPVLVLDEPTAALDPIAENQIYLQYLSMTAGKTSLFISHRLASTQFCDRILYLKDGRIAEEGTHAELTAKNSEYSRLYEMQSCWYRENYR